MRGTFIRRVGSVHPQGERIAGSRMSPLFLLALKN